MAMGINVVIFLHQVQHLIMTDLEECSVPVVGDTQGPIKLANSVFGRKYYEAHRYQAALHPRRSTGDGYR